MPKPEQYGRIADRYVSAGQLTMDQVPEAGGFAAYHAFESIGCAWLRHKGQKVPKAHAAKINKFVQAAKPHQFAHGAAYLAILTNALRNKMLYPISTGTGAYDLPEALMSTANCRDLLKRVSGLVRQVRRTL